MQTAVPITATPLRAPPVRATDPKRQFVVLALAAFAIGFVGFVALGRPLAASDVGGHRELIRNGVDGVLFPAGDADALAAVVTELLRDAARRQSFAAEGRRRALNDMRWDHSVSAYTAVYERLLAPNGAH